MSIDTIPKPVHVTLLPAIPNENLRHKDDDESDRVWSIDLSHAASLYPLSIVLDYIHSDVSTQLELTDAFQKFGG